MQTKKKKMLTTGLAVALAALLLIGGGTFAYLQSASDDVVNEFDANKVQVELEETTGGDYNIVPGTTETKDPKVTVTNTVDAYVFVEVTDKTDGLVTYEIADGWELLNGYDNVYYREVAEDADVKEFYVLKGNKVIYSAELENSNMLDANGNLKTGIELTFKAYAIQKEPFTDAAEAYLGIPISVATGDEFKDALGSVSEGQTIKLAEDVYIEYTGTHPDGTYDTYITKPNCTIDLNGKTVTVNNNGYVLSLAGNGITIKNGTITLANTSNTSYPLYVTSGAKDVVIEDVDIVGGIQVIGNSSATLRNVDINATVYYDIYLEYKSTVTVESGIFTKAGNKPHIWTNTPTDQVIVKGGLFDGSETPTYGGNGTVTIEN